MMSVIMYGFKAINTSNLGKRSPNPACFFGLHVFPGEIRCYCDAPHCVATGYMCKSELNACFTKVLDPLNANSPLTHGCLDPIANTVDVCSSSSRSADTLSGASATTLECCHDDMCNYRGLQDLAHTRDSTGKRRKLAELNHWLSGCLLFSETEILFNCF